MHRIGFIGYDGMGAHYHYQVATDRKDICPDLEPAAVYDVRESQRQLARERGLAAYDNFEDFIAHEDMDIVLVACTNNFHCEMTCRSLEAGKHVICEKPAAMSPEEFALMVETSERTGKKLFIHQNRRTDCDFQTVKHAYDTGRLGKLIRIESGFQGGLMAGWRTFKDHAGGILYDWGVHLIDQIVYLVGEPVKSVYAELRSEKVKEVDDSCIVEITFESGVKGRIHLSSNFLVPCPRLVAYGDKGAVWVNSIYDSSATLREATSAKWETGMGIAYNENGAYEREEYHLKEEISEVKYPDDRPPFVQDWTTLYRNMLDTIDGKAEMLVKHDEVMTVLRIIEAAFKSSETGMPVKL